MVIQLLLPLQSGRHNQGVEDCTHTRSMPLTLPRANLFAAPKTPVSGTVLPALQKSFIGHTAF